MDITTASRSLYNRLAQGWNTWDVSSVTAHVLLPARLRINLVLVLRDRSFYTGNAHWEQVERFGEHAADGSCTDLTLRVLDGAYRVQSAVTNGALVLKVTPVRPVPGVFAAVEASGIWGSRPVFEHKGDAVLTARIASLSYAIRSQGPVATPPWNPMTAPHLVVAADGPVSFTVESDHAPGAIDAAVASASSVWRAATIHAEGELEEGLAAMRRSLLWNMIYEPRHGRVATPVSRNWCQARDGMKFGHYVLFGWDTFFAALQFGLINRDLAYAAFFSILEERSADGMVPNCGSGSWNTLDRSEPQVGSLCAWKLYQQFGDRWFLEECFEPLLEWNRWRFRERDFNGDGLLEIASDPGRRDRNDTLVAPRQSAMYESGLDNSPMWDAAHFNPEKGCVELSFVGLNAEMAWDCELLAKIAAVLGRGAERAELLERREKLSLLINERLWDEKKGTYLNRHWSGELDPVLAPFHFYPLTAGIASPNRAARLIDEHLCNEKEFWGDFVIPTVSRAEPSFRDQDYWRGRIWAPSNFLVGEGLFRCGRFDVWSEVVARGLGLLLKAWREKGVVGENYDAVTGEAGKPGTHSDPFYHWGALLAYMAVERIVNFNEFEDRVDLHPLPAWASSLSRVPCGKGMLEVRGSEVRLDGKVVADTRGGSAHLGMP
jgi:putative isomerase